MKFVKLFSQLNKNDVAIAGGKGASLGEMTQAGIPVPPGFVILANAFDKFLKETDLNVEIDAVLDTVDIKEVHTIENASEKIRAMILSKEMPKDIKAEILKFYQKLDCKFVAVRSSATSEDSASAAWAGQLDSFLNTTENTLLENVKKCWASLFTPRAIFYRFEKELSKDTISVAVVVQKMVDSEKSGIAFSVHPVTQDKNQIIIEAGFGLGEAIVSGSITPDSYVVDKQELKILDVNINEQTKALYKKPKGGNEWRKLGEKGKEQVLNKKEIIELSKLITKIENHYGFPVDIEWAKEKRKFYITQSRPITTLNKSNKTEKKLQKTVTRFYYPISIQAWFNGATNELKKIIGVGFSDVIMKFDGKKVEVFRIAEELQTKIKMAMLNYVITKNFSEGLNDYKKLIKKYDKVLSEKNNIFKAVKLYEKLYPIFAVSYFVSNFWVDELPNNKKEYIIKLCTKYRKISDGILNRLDQFVANFLKKRKLSYFTILGVAKNKNKAELLELKWLKNGYIFSKGKFQNISWVNFLQNNRLFYEEETILNNTKNIIHGSIAFSGRVIGKVKIVFSPFDFKKIKNGDILVSPMTQPTFVPILSKIAGIVTDEGGVTSHAAIVAREMNKPCIIGTKIATQVLKDGMKVEVDANNGIVKIIKNNKKF